VRGVFREEQGGRGTMMEEVTEEEGFGRLIPGAGDRQRPLGGEEITEFPVRVPSDEEGGFHGRRPVV